MPGFQSKSQNAIATYLADDDGNVLGSASYPLTVTSSGGGGAQQVQGNSAAGATDTGNGVKISAVFNTTVPTYTSGQRTDLQTDSRANLRVRPGGVLATLGATLGTVVLTGRAEDHTTNGALGVAGYLYTGTTQVPASGDATAAYTKNPPRPKGASGVTAGSTTSQQLFAANTTRTRLVIQNQDASINVFVNLGAAAVAGAGSLRIAPGATLELGGTNETVNLIAASGTPAITAWEF